MRLYRLLASLESVSKIRLNAMIIGTILGLGTIDYLTGTELSMSFFYLIPVSMAAWALGRYSGFTYSVASAAIWLISNVLSGETFSIALIGVWNTLIRFGFFGVVTVLLTELHIALESERLLANTDPLTGALNRRSFNEIAEKKMIAAELNRRPYTVVYIDLDDFKIINDKFGHAIGDRVLKAVADSIQGQIRSTDFLARLGGDEFALLLIDLGQEGAHRIVQRLHQALLDKMKIHAWDQVTFSIGVLTFLTMPASVDEMVSLTDMLMYEVKSGGKNAIQYSVYD